MSDAIVMFGLSSVCGLITAIFWRWVSAISKTQDTDRQERDLLHKQLVELRAEMYREYQSKADAQLDNKKIIDMLREIKTNVNRLSDKLDRKADK